MKERGIAQSTYERAVDDLKKFCEKETDLQPLVIDGEYPVRVQFIPNPQLNCFGNENIDENGEVNDLTVTVGLSTDVRSTLRFKMDSKLLKKLIRLAENVGFLYYHAFREEQGARLTPSRVVEDEGSEEYHAFCPFCMESQDVESLERVLDPPFCYKCGQALDWSNEKEESAFEEAMQELRKQIGGQHAKTEPEANETVPTDKPSA